MKSAIGESRSWHNVFNPAGDGRVKREVKGLDGLRLAHWSWLLRCRLWWKLNLM